MKKNNYGRDILDGYRFTILLSTELKILAKNLTQWFAVCC